jgi:hypothetical protein
MKQIIAFVFVGILLVQCTFDKHLNKVDSIDYGNVELVITPVVGGKPVLKDTTYLTPKGEKYRISALRFFVSDIALAKSVGKECQAVTEHGNSVFLIEYFEEDLGNQPATNVVRFKIPEGSYSDVRFTIGVPRNLNHSDPTANSYPLEMDRGDMYWNWNSGYIFFLMEGKGEDVYKNKFHLAIGSDQRIMPFTFGNLFDVVPLVNIQKNKTTKIKFNLEVNELLINADKTFYSLNTFESTNVHGGLYADALRQNLLNALHFVSSETKR